MPVRSIVILGLALCLYITGCAKPSEPAPQEASPSETPAKDASSSPSVAEATSSESPTGAAESTPSDREVLQRIGLAFHNYHGTYKHLPSVDSPGGEGQPTGLSWRVHLLPFLEQSPLYQKFHLDEPWDSPHNSALIAEMPDIFGNDPDGKTRFHVLTGDGTLFQMGKGNRFRDIKDGTSNTIGAVKAGAGTAEVWTKPVGLAFDPAHPLQCLGQAERESNSFPILLMDGRVRQLPADINPDQFRRLAQLADGEVVGEY